jgi:hypothetical protein
MNKKSIYRQWVQLPALLALLAISLPVFSQSEAGNEIQGQIKPVSLFGFSDELKENSGMVYSNGLWWTLNDSGGEAVIYGVDGKGTVQARLLVENATNVDWEDIAQDERYLYVADTGNNAGNRKNLGIYRILKAHLPTHGDTTATAEFMGYTYEDQSDFDLVAHGHPFDCEALVAMNDSLYLFTKDWQTEKTSMYVLHFSQKDCVARKRAEFDAGGLVTGADISPNGKIIALSGYVQMKPFVWVLRDFEPGKPFSGKRSRISLDMLFMAQTEGITVSDDGLIRISCEKTPLFPAQVFELVGDAGKGHE